MFALLNHIGRLLFGRRLAVEKAIQQFESLHGQSALSGAVIYEDQVMYVVRVCYAPSRPPSRAWFAVYKIPNTIEELEFDTVQAFGERPWR